jgi:hypothetical protein
LDERKELKDDINIDISGTGFKIIEDMYVLPMVVYIFSKRWIAGFYYETVEFSYGRQS